MKRPLPRTPKKTSKDADVPGREPNFPHGRAYERLRDFDTARGLPPPVLPGDATPRGAVPPRRRSAKRSGKK